MKLLISVITLTIHGGIPPHHLDEKLVIAKNHSAIYETTSAPSGDQNTIGKFSCEAPEAFTKLLMSPKLPKKKTAFAPDSTIAQIHIGSLDRIWRYEGTEGFEAVEQQYESLKQKCLQNPKSALRLQCAAGTSKDPALRCSLKNPGTDEVKTVDPTTSHESIKCLQDGKILNPGSDAVPPQRIAIKGGESFDFELPNTVCNGQLVIDLTELHLNSAYSSSLLGALNSNPL